MSERHGFKPEPDVSLIPPAAQRRSYLLLLVVACAVIFPFNGLRPLFDTTETRYAEAARGIAASGNWLVPQIAGVPHLTKPPITYWLIAACIRLFGTGEWAVRLSPALAFLGAVFMISTLARLLFGAATGLLAGWLMLLAVFPSSAANTVNTDSILNFMELTAVTFLWLCLRQPDEKRGRLWGYLSFLTWGLAFMTKGPPGLLPWTAILVFAYLTRRELPWRRLFRVGGLLIFLCVVAAWPAMILARVPNAVNVWKLEIVTKALETPDRHIPRIRYLLVLLGGAFPGVLALLYVRTLWTSWRAGTLPAAEKLALRFLALWFCLPLVVFILAKQRLYLYILPLFAPLCIFYARLLTGYWMQATPARRQVALRWSTIGAAAVAIALVSGRWIYGHKLDDPRSFRALAELIRADAKDQGLKPRLLIPARGEGTGLLYYLDGPPIEWFGMRHKGAGPGRGQLLWNSLQEEVPAGYAEYVILKRSQGEGVLPRIQQHVQKEFHTRAWFALRRDPHPISKVRRNESASTTSLE